MEYTVLVWSVFVWSVFVWSIFVWSIFVWSVFVWSIFVCLTKFLKLFIFPCVVTNNVPGFKHNHSLDEGFLNTFDIP